MSLHREDRPGCRGRRRGRAGPHDLTQAEQTAAAADANLHAARAREAERAANLAREIAQVRADQRTTEGDLASAAITTIVRAIRPLSSEDG